MDNAAPVVTSLNRINNPIEIGSPVSFSPTITDPGIRDSFTYLWSVTANNGQSVLGGDQRDFSFTPEFAGRYRVSLIVTDSDGSTSLPVEQVVDVIPLVGIGIDNPTGDLKAGELVTFVGFASDLAPAGGTIGSAAGTRLFDWTIRLGANTVAKGSGPKAPFVPTVPGDYTVSLTVSDVFAGIPFSATVVEPFAVLPATVVAIQSENDITAPDFDGVNDQINLVVIPQPPTSNFSVAAWIKPDSFSGFRKIISGPSWGLGFDGTSLILSKYTANFTDFKVLGAPALPIGVWTHVAATMNSAFSVEFFVNGVSIGVVPSNLPMNVESGSFFIGSRGGSEFFDGMIRDVGVWSTALNAAQINEIRAGNFQSSNPLHFWRLNEDAGTTIRSSSSSSIGTLVNGLGWASQTMASKVTHLPLPLATCPPFQSLEHALSLGACRQPPS